MRDGTVAGWGDNSTGQTETPSGLHDVTAVAAGHDHSLALLTDGTVIGWGDDASGEATSPEDLTDVIAIAAGTADSLALKGDGTVVAWGADFYGQTDVPDGLSDVIAIDAGEFHSLALKSDGTVVVWGDNSLGQTNVPPGLSGVTAISAGGYHSLALQADGTVIAWGYNNCGSTTDVPPGLGTVIAIAAGGCQNLALKADGTVVAWGGSGLGQDDVPPGLSRVIAVAAGFRHNLALVAEDELVPMDGEVLAGFNGIFDPTSSDPQPGLCSPSGFTYNFSTSGPAGDNPDAPPTDGPYPGTFTESGSIAVGSNIGTGLPPGTVRGRIFAVSIDFEIHSGDTSITGHKWLKPGAEAYFTCGNFDEPNPDVGGTSHSYIRSYSLQNQLGYAVTITSADGELRDAGSATLEYDKNHYYQAVPGVVRTSAARFREFFASSGSPTDTVAPIVTGTADRAPNGNGWYKAPVMITWTTTDPAPSSGQPSTVPPTIASIDGLNRLYPSYPSCDPAGNCTTGQLSLSIDQAAPNLVTPITRFILGDPIATSPRVTVDWAGSFDATSGIAGYDVRSRENGKCCSQVSNGTATNWVSPALVIGKSYEFQIAGSDLAGNSALSAFGPVIKLTAFDDPKSVGAVVYSPTNMWTAKKEPIAYQGTLTTTTSLNASATFAFKGSQVAFVAPTTTAGGSARIYVDGTLTATINLRTAANVARQVVFIQAFAAAGNHTLRVESAGGGPVSVDAFFVMK
jgi:hypothetical protein